MMEKSVVNIPMKMPDFILEIWGIHHKILPSTMLGTPTEESKGCKRSNSVYHPVGTVDEEKTSRTM